MTKKLTVVVSRGREASSSRQPMQRDLVCALKDWPNVDVVVLPHLVDLVPDGPEVRRLRSIEGDLIVLSWLYPRAAYWVLRAHWIEGPMGRLSSLAEGQPEAERETDSCRSGDDGEVSARTIWCLDLREYDGVESILEEIGRIAAEATVEATVALGRREAAAADLAEVSEPVRHRWYPVIDYSRCGNCLECLNFCLFGVFALDASDQLVVDQPDACRDGCPACSRVCPSHAIIFPQHKSPAIAGDDEASDEGFDVDLVQLLGAAGGSDLGGRRERVAEPNEPAGSGRKKPGKKDDLDRLVDDLDGLDL